MGASTRSRKREHGPAWIALDHPIEFEYKGEKWAVQDYNRVVDMFLCESQQDGKLIVWIARADQVIEYVGLVPGIRSRQK